MDSKKYTKCILSYFIRSYKMYVNSWLSANWVINSVGSECYLDRVEVTGSNPVWPTLNEKK